MKKLLLVLLACLLLAAPNAGGAEADRSVVAFGQSFPVDTVILDLDAAGVQSPDAGQLRQLIDQLPNLKEVWLFDSDMPREDMELLFDSYPHVFFGWTLRFATHTVRTDATAFSTLHHSTIKDKKDYEHGDRQLSMLRMCTRLKALDLGHNQLTDLTFLSELTGLKVLILSPNYDLKDLSPLAALTELEYLELFSTDARDVSALFQMHLLKDLNLSCSHYLHDLSPLYGLSSLERFWGGRGGIEREEQKRMEENHPDCQFDWENNPTGGTWREHPRYNIIHSMFTSGEYIPFE